jgi:LuxR family maltose regulon positive regulatory protein
MMPARRSGVIGRARLLARMGSPADTHRLTVIVAPAGFGKTTLVREWCAARTSGENSGIAWVSLDGSEDDPTRFLTYLTMAVRVVHPDFGEGALALLRSPQPAPRESVLTVLLNDLHTLPTPLCLVLDDYHLITERAVHESVAYLLDHLPPIVHLIIASRVDPPLPLSRLRVRGELTELRAADLRCLGEEAREFLTGVMGLTLPDEDIAALETRTEGWMAGLQLAALSLQNRPDAKAFITAFTGSNRYIVDYLGEEVLRQQPERLRRFLALTSILHRLCGPLCDAVLGDEAVPGEGQALLEEMDSANLFLVALDDDRRWYRYHHLFGDMLRVRLQQEQSHLLPELHRRAADWYAHEGMDDDAVRHALIGRHYEMAARLMERSVERLWRRGETQTLMRWMSELPDTVRRGSARLCLFQARMHVMAAETERMAATLEDAERVLSPDDPDYRYLLGQAQTHRAYLSRMRGDDDTAMDFAEEAMETLASSSSDVGMWPAVVRVLLGTIHAVRGNTERAVRMLSEAAEVCERVPDPQVALVARSIEGVLHEEQGRLRRAEETYRRGLDFVTSLRMEQLPMAGYVYVGLGSIALLRNELDAAEEYVRRGLMLGGEANAADIYLRGTRILAFVRLARGDQDDARRLLDEMAAFARNITLPQIQDIVAVTRARFHLAVGDLTTAEGWEASLLQERTIPPVPTSKTLPASPAGASSVFLQDVTALTFARLRLAQNRPHDTLSLLVPIRENAVAQGRFSTEIECEVLAALAYQASGNPESARSALTAALRRARPEGYVRPFLDAGPLLTPLLRDIASRGIEPEYVRTLLAGFGPEAAPAPSASPARRPTSPLLDPLTEREIEVLGLVAEGLSNADIAERLFLSVGTVKRHVHNIFGKLDAGGRVEAIARARTLGIL